MSYTHRIICDVDDTISFTINRDWENATPNTRLIQKLNSLYDQGWEIEYYTARGSLSCKSRTEAKETYSDIITTWFKKHGVKYSKLSFDKPLAAYYIDDKGIKPEEFLDLDIEILQGGQSGAQIERRGNLVYKTHENSLEAASWYKKASNIIKTVRVHSVIGNTLCIDYVENDGTLKFAMIDYVLSQFKTVPSYADFQTYSDRIKEHMNYNNVMYSEKVLSLLNSIKDTMNNNKTFAHGDMSLDNMIVSNDILYLIDPNAPEGLYSSWLLDVAKILHSAKRFNKSNIYNYYRHKYKEHSVLLSILELTHWIRQRKYVDNPMQIDIEIDKLLDELK